jgi:diguanylate cyclase (GGDEF)-like protein
MLYVDKFKAYNDAYGHQAGDQCLKAIGRLLRHCIKRPMDLAARYGGEEFAVVLPETDEDGAYSVALAIAKGLRESNLPHKASEKGRVTISIGVATYHQDAHPRSTHDLIAMADEALYGAKAAGRDRINGRASRNVVPMVR